jgi:hypothetical protein
MLLFWLDPQQGCGSALFLEAGSGSASETLDKDPDPHSSAKKLISFTGSNRAVEAQNEAMEGLSTVDRRFPSL